MGIMTHILVAVDRSEASEAALLTAARLARRDEARLTVLHIVDQETARLPWGRLLGIDPVEAELRVKRERAAEVVTWIAERGIELPRGAVRVEFGWPPRRIAQVADELRCDQVVVSGGRHTGLGRLLLGSTTDRLVRLSHLPVRVVKSAVASRARRVLVAVDFDEASSTALDLGRKAAAADGAELTVLHCYADPGEAPPLSTLDPSEWGRYRTSLRTDADSRLKAFLAASGGEDDVTVILVAGDPATAIVRHAEAMDADLVVLGHRRHAWERFLGWTSEHVLRAARCDVVVVPIPALLA